MSTSSGIDTYIWSDEESRFYLQLRVEEKRKGNARNLVINDAGQQNIITKFYEEFGKKHSWKKFRNKLNTSRKQYASFKRLTHNRTGISYDSKGFVDASDDWWEERIKEWPGARKIREKPVYNMDLMEELFGAVQVSGAEGWSAQQGEDHLNFMIPDEPLHESDAASETRPTDPTPTQAPDVPSSSNLPRVNRKRRATHDVADAIRNSAQTRDEILSQKNQLLEEHPDYSCSQIRAMRVLHSLSSVRLWSPLYKAAILHLKTDPTNRQTFLSYEDDENKILYLEFATGETRDA